MKRITTEIRGDLLQIDTGFNGVRIDSFSSFLVTKGQFPSNDDIKNKFDAKGIESFTPKDFQSKSDKSGADSDAIFEKKSFKFPNDFFNNDKVFNDEYMFVGLNAAYRTEKKDYSGWGNFRDTERPTNTYKLYVQTNDKSFRGCYITDIIKSYEDSNSGNVMRNFFINDDEISFLNHPESTQNLDARRIDRLILGHYQDELLKAKNMLKKIDDDYKAKKPYVGKKYQLKESRVKEKSVLMRCCIENKKTLDNSLDIFIRECLIIQPKWLVVFGNDANEVLNKMVVSDYFKDKVNTIESQDEKSQFNVMDLLEHRRVEVTHYATQSVPLKKYQKGSGDKKKNKKSEKEERGHAFRDWYNYAPDELITKVDELKEKEKVRRSKESNNK
ncbi:hypothetical protein D1B17_07600 [Companilactobacillus zhachilii]|uniref:Uncharacterized protein n=1 Tax=Companilactobacillus zhachilii TaxID=2304606 RepID=A0A386PVK5_9LACO|nr:hypothetical protein [Companilactobacillus zhachilii]AYE38510.1 hypothetical protein D1B17_07600 [Companilactobacillus zhachilii]